MTQYIGDVNPSTLASLDWGDENARWSGAQVQDGLKQTFKTLEDKAGYVQIFEKFVCSFRNKTDYETWLTLPDKIAKFTSNLLLSYSKIKYEDLTNKVEVITLGQIGNINLQDIENSVTLTKDNCIIKNLQFKLLGLDDEDNPIDFSTISAFIYHITLNNVDVKTGVCKVDSLNMVTISDIIDLRNDISGNSNNLIIWVEFDHSQTGVVSTLLKGHLAFDIRLNDFKLSFANDTFWTNPFYLENTGLFNLGLNISGSFGQNKAILTVKADNFVIFTGEYESNASSSRSVPLYYKQTNEVGDSIGYFNVPEGVHKLTCQYSVNGVLSPEISKNVLFLNQDSTQKYICFNLSNSEFNNYSVSELGKCLIYSKNLEDVFYKVVVNGVESTETPVQYTSLELITINYNFGIESLIDILEGSMLIRFKTDEASKTYNFTLNNNVNNRFDALTSDLKYNIDPASLIKKENIISKVAGVDTTLQTIWNEVTWGTSDSYITESINGFNIAVLKLLKNLSAIIKSDYGFLNTADSFAFEIMYKVTNSTNLNDPIILCTKPSGDTIYGLLIFPEVILYQANINNTYTRKVSTKSDEILHVVITYSNNLNGWGNYPVTKIYINGKIAGELNAEAASLKGCSLVLGGKESNLTIYKIRTYDTMLSDYNVLKNYMNCLGYDMNKRIQLKTTNNSVYNETELDRSKISYEKIKLAGLNCFVLSSTDPKYTLIAENAMPLKSVLPGRGNDIKVKDALIELYWDKSRYPKNENVAIQLYEKKDDGSSTDSYLRYLGTSSKDYYRWNWRSAFSKGCNITYLDKVDLENPESLVVEKDGKLTWYTEDGTKFRCSYIAAKKNTASSMQSHKLGFTSSYQDLYDVLSNTYSGLKSDLLYTDNVRNTNRVCVYQYPFFGFIKVADEITQAETYLFVGLYTLGPDKGDKAASGLDTKNFKDLLQIEGLNNDSGLANFSVPFENLYYNADETIHSSLDPKDNNKGIEITSISDENKGSNNGVSYLASKFKDAYDLVYNNSVNIKYAGLEYNANIDHFDKSIYSVYWFGDPTLFTDNTEVKFYRLTKQNKLIEIPVLTKTYNLVGKTIEEANQFIIDSRALVFYNNCRNYFEFDDMLFWYMNIEINSGTDERGKNIYLYNLGTETDNKWRFRIDDTDSRLMVDNQGRPTIKYSIELGDTEGGRGQWDNTSQLLALINHKVFYDDRMLMFKNIVQAMSSLAGESDVNIDNILKFYNKYFWKSVCDYFTEIGYGADVYFTYDQALFVLNNKGNFDYDNGGAKADLQVLGDNILPEKNFLSKRLIFLGSKYKYNKLSDTLTFGRLIKKGTFGIFYSDDTYPVYYELESNNLTTSDKRYSPEDRFEFSLNSETFVETGFGPRQNVKKIDTDWSLVSVVEGSTIAIENLPNLTEFSVEGFGENMTFNNLENLTKLTVTNCPKISELNLKESQNLQNLTVLGTSNIKEIKLPTGAPLESLTLPSSLVEIHLLDLLKLPNYTYTVNSNALKQFFVLNCSNTLNPINKLFTYKNLGCLFTNFYIAGINETWDSASSATNLQLLTSLADYITYNNIKGYTKTNEGTYVASEEEYSKPLLSGTINLNCDYFENDIDKIKESIDGDLQIIPSKNNYKFIRYNWTNFNTVLKNWLEEKGIQKPGLAGIVYARIYTETPLQLDSNSNYKNTIMDYLTQFHKYTSGLSGHPLATESLLSEDSVDLMDWGKRFPNKLPMFVRFNNFNNAKLNLLFNEPTTVNLGAIGSDLESKLTWNYDTLNVDGGDLVINSGVPVVGSYLTKLKIQNLNITANKLKFIYTNFMDKAAGGGYRTVYPYSNPEEALIIHNLNIDTTQIPDIEDANLFTRPDNVYINQNLFWNYISSTNSYKRIELLKYYIPFANGTATNIPKIMNYPQNSRIFAGVGYNSNYQFKFEGSIELNFALHKLNRYQCLLYSKMLSIYINELNKVIIKYVDTSGLHKEYIINLVLKLNEVNKFILNTYGGGTLSDASLNGLIFEDLPEMIVVGNDDFYIGNDPSNLYFIGSLFESSLDTDVLIIPTESGLTCKMLGGLSSLQFIDGQATLKLYLTNYIKGIKI